MKYGSNTDWKALHEESLRRAQQAREAERQRQIFEAVYHPAPNRNAAGGAASSGGNPNPNISTTGYIEENYVNDEYVE
jgi:hypothetical protein